MGIRDYADRHKHDAHVIGEVALVGGMIKRGLKKWPVTQCEVTLDTGANVAARMTGTRVIGGAVLAGPVGALIGGLAKKNRSKVFLGIAVPGDAIVIEIDAKKEGDARRFVAKVAAATQQFQAIEGEELAAKAKTIEASAVAGWYPVEGQLRWWDGEQWTDHYAPLPS